MLIIFLANKFKINLERLKSFLRKREKKLEKKVDNMIPDEKIEKIYDEFNGAKRKQYRIGKKTQKRKKNAH